MNRRNKTLERRNRQIYAEYIAHLRNSFPAMDAYAALSLTYDLDVDHIRRIIRQQAKFCSATQ